MIREGCFKEYVNTWNARFPQRKLISQVRDLHSKYGLSLFDAHLVARSMGADEDIVLEVGENVLLRKRNDDLAIFHKVGDIWIQVDKGMDALDSEQILSKDSHMLLTSICDETKIFKARSVKELASSTMRFMNRWCCIKGKLFSFGKREIWELSGDGRIRIYSNSLNDKSIFNSEDEIAKHIEFYRKAHRFEFGSF